MPIKNITNIHHSVSVYTHGITPMGQPNISVKEIIGKQVVSEALTTTYEPDLRR